mgnify:CR=1 FL=1
MTHGPIHTHTHNIRVSCDVKAKFPCGITRYPLHVAHALLSVRTYPPVIPKSGKEGKTHLSDSHVRVKGAVSGSIKEQVFTTLFTQRCVHKVFQT